MAISLAHGVMAYFNDRGSAVYTCSLDAEGAFDAIPHVYSGSLTGSCRTMLGALCMRGIGRCMSP